MTEHQIPPDGTTAMTFQLILEKLHALEEALDRAVMLQEQALHQTVPLLGKIITHLEAQHAAPEVPVAGYDQIYTELQADVPAETCAPPAPPQAASARLRRWFTREVPHGE